MHTLTLIPPTSVRSFKQQLLSTTAFTPTYHKGGIAKIVPIVAAVAIPFAAPTIASALSISTTLGPALSGALVGAGLGAATAAITGQDPLRGAAMGGITGGIGGYMRAPAGIDPFTGNPISVAPAGSGAAGLGYAPNTLSTPASVGVQSGIGTGSGIGLQDMLPGANIDDPTYGLYGTGQPALGYAASNPGVQLSGQPALGYAASNPSLDAYPPDVILKNIDFFPSNNVPPPPNASAGQLVSVDNPWGVNRRFASYTPGPDPQSVSNVPQEGRMTPLGSNYRPIGYAGNQLTTDPFTGNPISAPTPTLGERFTSGLRGFVNDPMAAIKDLPDYAKYGGVQAGTQALSNLFASKPEITAAEQAALDQRARLTKLEEAKQLRNQAISNQALANAQMINPVQLGMESAADAAARYRRGINNRNLSGAQLAAARRRDALNQALVGSTAFTQGRDAGLARRMAGISRAANTGANYTALSNMASNDLGAAQAYQKRLNQERGNFANMATPLLAGSVFGMTDEELRAQEKRLRDQAKTIKGTAIS